ncbi:MAG: hypothetical protein SFV51_28660 [Bryobacteraceae bacterium]|nr:hypothetical protein [Bryobacteraceae bacterium]
MFNKLFKRMAPLVAGVVLLAMQSLQTQAAYPQISSFVYINSYEVEVTVSTSPYTTFWWFGQSRNNTAPNYDGLDVANTYPGYTNVCVYVYETYPGSDYSYAIIDSVQGTTIWNGP